MKQILIVFCVGFLIIAFPLFSDGMFMDGLIYASVSDNLANGDGSMFHLSFSKTVLRDFYEHPPLAIWMESIFHHIFNGSHLSERFYSLFTWIINGVLVLWLWKELKQPNHLAWVPLFFWLVLPDVGWAFANNLLENTMGIFVTLSIIMYIKSLESRRVLFVFLYSLSIVLILLSKGFTGTYVLAFPMLVGVFWKKEFLLRSIADTLATLGIVLLILSSIYFSSSEAAFYFSDYLAHQVKGSLENVQTVPFRGQIVLEYFNSLIIPGLIVMICYLYGRKKGLINVTMELKNLALVLVLLSLCGVLPIMISLKQRSFYTLTVLPFAIIALSMYVIPVLKVVDSLLKKYFFKNVILTILVIASITLAIISTSYIGREETTIKDVYTMHELIPEGTIVSTASSSLSNWVLLGYLSRIAKISVKRYEEGATYYLRRISDPDISSQKEYIMEEFVLEMIDTTANPQ